MLFNSLAFLLFFPLVFAIYWLVLKKYHQAQNLLILIASYFFYGWWSWKLTFLLLASTLLDYIFGGLIIKSKDQRAKFFLVSSILLNLGFLGYFKYFNFFATEFNILLQKFGLSASLPTLEIILPIGISFYTFHGMSYVIDCYRRQLTTQPKFVDYAVFVSFFPLLVAGPIERAQHLLPQVSSKRTFNYSQWVEGSRLILWGLFKKVVIADSLAQIANPIFADYPNMSPMMLLVGSLAFTFQIYGDFSGYSDIALGSAKLLGFELLSNFKFPYFSRSIAEFWRRWHISLSSWFRDYLYIPLGGSREGMPIALRNTMIIFLVSGFWHGASWNFIAWGALHGLFFIPLMLRKNKNQFYTSVVANDTAFPTIGEFFQMSLTFCLVAIAWIFFRMPNIHDAFIYSRNLFSGLFKLNFNISHPDILNMTLLWIPVLLIMDWLNRHDERNFKVPQKVIYRWGLYLAMTFLIFMSSNKDQTFLYFQF